VSVNSSKITSTASKSATKTNNTGTYSRKCNFNCYVGPFVPLNYSSELEVEGKPVGNACARVCTQTGTYA